MIYLFNENLDINNSRFLKGDTIGKENNCIDIPFQNYLPSLKSKENEGNFLNELTISKEKNLDDFFEINPDKKAFLSVLSFQEKIVSFTSSSGEVPCITQSLVNFMLFQENISNFTPTPLNEEQLILQDLKVTKRENFEEGNEEFSSDLENNSIENIKDQISLLPQNPGISSDNQEIIHPLDPLEMEKPLVYRVTQSSDPEIKNFSQEREPTFSRKDSEISILLIEEDPVKNSSLEINGQRSKGREEDESKINQEINGPSLKENFFTPNTEVFTNKNFQEEKARSEPSRFSSPSCPGVLKEKSINETSLSVMVSNQDPLSITQKTFLENFPQSFIPSAVEFLGDFSENKAKSAEAVLLSSNLENKSAPAMNNKPYSYQGVLKYEQSISSFSNSSLSPLVNNSLIKENLGIVDYHSQIEAKESPSEHNFEISQDKLADKLNEYQQGSHGGQNFKISPGEVNTSQKEPSLFYFKAAGNSFPLHNLFHLHEIENEKKGILNLQDLSKETVRAIQHQTKNLSFQLYPEKLGRIEISVEINIRDQLKIYFQTQNQESSEFLKRDLAYLHQTLNQSGYNNPEININCSSDSEIISEKGFQFSSEQNQSNSPFFLRKNSKITAEEKILKEDPMLILSHYAYGIKGLDSVI